MNTGNLISKLERGGTYSVKEGTKINIVAKFRDNSVVNSALFRIESPDGTISESLDENSPFSAFRGTKLGMEALQGIYIVSAVGFSEGNGEGCEGPLEEVEFTINFESEGQCDRNEPAVSSLSLVNSKTREKLFNLTESGTYVVSKDINITIIATFKEETNSAQFRLEDPIGGISDRKEENKPFTALGGNKKYLNGFQPMEGEYKLTVQGYDKDKLDGCGGPIAELSFSLEFGESEACLKEGQTHVSQLTLMNTETREPIEFLKDGKTYNVKEGIQYSIVAQFKGSVRSAHFQLHRPDGTIFENTEEKYRWALFGGDTLKKLGSEELLEGKYLIRVTGYSKDKLKGCKGVVEEMAFEIKFGCNNNAHPRVTGLFLVNSANRATIGRLESGNTYAVSRGTKFTIAANFEGDTNSARFVVRGPNDFSSDHVDESAAWLSFGNTKKGTRLSGVEAIEGAYTIHVVGFTEDSGNGCGGPAEELEFKIEVSDCPTVKKMVLMSAKGRAVGILQDSMSYSTNMRKFNVRSEFSDSMHSVSYWLKRPDSSSYDHLESQEPWDLFGTGESEPLQSGTYTIKVDGYTNEERVGCAASSTITFYVQKKGLTE